MSPVKIRAQLPARREAPAFHVKIRPCPSDGVVQKRAALARALIMGPRIVSFDEPATGRKLDQGKRRPGQDCLDFSILCGLTEGRAGEDLEIISERTALEQNTIAAVKLSAKFGG